MAMVVTVVVVVVVRVRMIVLVMIMWFTYMLMSTGVVILSMGLRMCSSFVFKPELGYRIAHDTSQGAQLSQRVPDAVLYIAR